MEVCVYVSVCMCVYVYICHIKMEVCVCLCVCVCMSHMNGSACVCVFVPQVKLIFILVIWNVDPRVLTLCDHVPAGLSLQGGGETAGPQCLLFCA